MLGFSLSKLIVLALIGLGAWYLFRMLAGLPANQQPRPNAQARSRPGPGAANSTAGRAQDAEDMVRCSVCGTYVAAKGAKACDNPACPWPK
jgi:uncharacterized protein